MPCTKTDYIAEALDIANSDVFYDAMAVMEYAELRCQSHEKRDRNFNRARFLNIVATGKTE